MGFDPVLLSAFSLAFRNSGTSAYDSVLPERASVRIGAFGPACDALGADRTGFSARGWLEIAEDSGLFDVEWPKTTSKDRQPRLFLKSGVRAPAWTPLDLDGALRLAHSVKSRHPGATLNGVANAAAILLSGTFKGWDQKAAVRRAEELGLVLEPVLPPAFLSSANRGGRERAWKAPLDEILPLIAAANAPAPLPAGSHRPRKHEIDGVAAHLVSKRLRVFAAKGCDCPRCGAKGAYFAAERSPGQEGGRHLNLYAIHPSGHEVLMTKDHRLPKSKGGDNSLGNLDPMCEPCNSGKGNRIDGGD